MLSQLHFKLFFKLFDLEIQVCKYLQAQNKQQKPKCY